MKRLLVSLTLSLLLPSSVLAQTVSKSYDPAVARSHWTPEAYAAARSVPLPRVEADAAQVLAASEGRIVSKKRTPSAAEGFEELFPSFAQAPTLPDREVARFRTRLFDFTPEELARLRADREEPVRLPEKVYGTGGLDYTSSRLIPTSAVEEFPYRPIGKLFFSDGTDDFVCSASVISERLVVTAGHCVHGGPRDGFYQDFVFIPAYVRGEAPFGSWSVTGVFVTSAWAASGQVPHAEDYAFLEIEDQGGQKIADVTGKLAFVPERLADNHLHLIGYPGNLDAGEEMHQVISGDWFAFGDGTVVYGSDMSGGSSGGPWIENFNRKAEGQGGGLSRARCAVVGVTSYGFLNDAIRAQGASNLTRTFRVLRQDACFNQPGNC